ncbi:MAG: AraC family transcriptional regulator [Saprospiraceae bacterium]|nr:AraC family transcriptional regulator [Saprospiraceae bacterium]MCB9320166.1 AraC family transcriptional regulator [Lewinellaceae bacterium]
MPGFWYLLFLAIVFQGCFMSLLFLLTAKSRQANLYLGLALLAFSVQLGIYILYWEGKLDTEFPWLSPLGVYLQLLFGPLLWLYMKSLKYEAALRSREALIHLGIGLLGIAYYLYSRVLFPVAPGGAPLFPRRYAVLFFFMTGILSLGFYGFLMVRTAYRDQSGSRFKSNWLKQIVHFYGLYVLAYYGYYVLVRKSFFTPYWDYCIGLLMGVGMYGIGYMAYRFPHLLDEKNQKKKLIGEQYESSTITDSAVNSILRQLDREMQEKAWYKDNISLDSLAKRINVNKHQLSQVINQGKGISFTEYINKLRIDESIRLLNEHPDLSIKEVYFKVGYANKTSFYAHFKRITGMTPTEFKALPHRPADHRNRTDDSSTSGPSPRTES